MSTVDDIFNEYEREQEAKYKPEACAGCGAKPGNICHPQCPSLLALEARFDGPEWQDGEDADDSDSDEEE